MATWPATLPAPRRSGLGLALGDNTMKRATQSGRSETRRWGSGAPDRLSLQLRVKVDLVPAFEQFFNIDLNRGLNWFDAEWLTTLLGYPDHKGRILGTPQVKVAGNRYRDYAMTILIKPSSACPDDTTWPAGG